ncbi:MAG: hypothetical protein KF749_05010 [Bacteroidetes bacterium]|nr:hypothetical protein [Bacteroidota bacterium]MCW5896504.1 hypothetical protein [Bacteroidota bacterium]
MRLIETGAAWVARMLNVPTLAITMFKKANEVSGIDKDTLPTELIPLNTIQLSRGLLNFTLLQSIRNWVFPYWAHQQYDPSSPAFIPRSHLGLSMNLTHRNWTAVGSPDCDVEPIVDPRGMVTPFRDGWSLDVWLLYDGKLYCPSQQRNVRQRLVNDVPIVETTIESGDLVLVLTTFVVKTEMVHRAEVRNNSTTPKHFRLFFAVRPFNPEGIGLVHDVQFVTRDNCFLVNNSAKVHFAEEPVRIACSGYEGGDCAGFVANAGVSDRQEAHCTVGLGNAAAGFEGDLIPRASKSVDAICSLQSPSVRWDKSLSDDPGNVWASALEKGCLFSTPDQRINALLTSSLSTLLLFVDRHSITPGPFTYHQFWFRDTAYMLWALEKFGFKQHIADVMQGFRDKQQRSGYFRSQQGEWDSNGQVLWLAWQHLRYTGDTALVQEQLESLRRGARWIEKKRLMGSMTEPYYGLLPRGMSAEHLGLADYYFWDNFWSLAGLESYAGICDHLGLSGESARTCDVLHQYRRDVERAIRISREKSSTQAITAGPFRNIDCGMIGSVCAWYPLQLFKPDDAGLGETLEALHKRFFRNGMFFQDFIHSGMNAYLTLQVAHAWLYGGNRKRFWEIFSTVCSFASPTMNFPEAIHPVTLGGCMGDGHHGWAAAEIALALRDAFLYEQETPNGSHLILLAGVPGSWFSSGKEFFAEKACVHGGVVGIRVRCSASMIEIQVVFERINTFAPQRMSMRLPVAVRSVSVDGESFVRYQCKGDETHIELDARSVVVRVFQ